MGLGGTGGDVCGNPWHRSCWDCGHLQGGQPPAGTALAVARQSTNAQVGIAREERQQRRLEAAYQELLVFLSHRYAWVLTVYPLWSAEGGYTMPPMPELPDKAKSEALLTAYWSPRVQQLMGPWQAALSAVHDAGMVISMEKAAEDRGQESSLAGQAAEARKNLDGFRSDVWDADVRIREQVRLELLGHHDGSAETELRVT
jgi:hypothetical protein